METAALTLVESEGFRGYEAGSCFDSYSKFIVSGGAQENNNLVENPIQSWKVSPSWTQGKKAEEQLSEFAKRAAQTLGSKAGLIELKELSLWPAWNSTKNSTATQFFGGEVAGSNALLLIGEIQNTSPIPHSFRNRNDNPSACEKIKAIQNAYRPDTRIYCENLKVDGMGRSFAAQFVSIATAPLGPESFSSTDSLQKHIRGQCFELAKSHLRTLSPTARKKLHWILRSEVLPRARVLRLASVEANRIIEAQRMRLEDGIKAKKQSRRP